MYEEYESASDKLDALMNLGTMPDTADNKEEEDDVEINDEDTDQVEAETALDDDETDTTDPIDGEDEETEDDDIDEDEDETEENTLVDDDNGEEPEAVAAEANTETDNEDNTAATDDDSEQKEDEVNYQTKYEELLAQSEQARNFYERATSEFTANGKRVKGFTDPEKVIQSQQMAAGLEQKMSVFKKHKPFFRGLQENGMIDDPAKFDLAMNMMTDKEAFKQHAKNQGWDLLDMDMDEVKYEPKQHTASPIEMALDDVMDNAARAGVKSKMEQALAEEWDNGSVVKLLENPQDSAILVAHMENGIYDAVQERISEKARVDVNGIFTGRTKYDQYMVASQELEHEYQTMIQREQSKKQQTTKAPAAEVQDDTAKIEAEKLKIEEGRKAAEYKKSVAQKEQEAKLAREKASRASKPKNKPRRSNKKVDKMSLTGSDFQNYFNREILGIN